MTELELWEAESRDEFAASVAGDVGFIIDSALEARREALVALPWADFLEPAWEKLAAQSRDWRHVTIVPTDDALVSVEDERSRTVKFARLFMPKGARVLPLANENEDLSLAGGAANARLSDLGWPLDLVLLAIDEGDESAGFVRGEGLDRIIASEEDIRATAVETQDGPVAAVSAHTVAKARTVMIAATKTARGVLDALATGEKASPIGRVLEKVTVPVDAHVLAG